MKLALQGRVERPWDATSFESGKGSSSKRQRVPNFIVHACRIGTIV